MPAMDTQLRRLIGGWTGISKIFCRIDTEEQYQYILECIQEAKAKRDDEGLRYLNGLVHILTLLAREYEATNQSPRAPYHDAIEAEFDDIEAEIREARSVIIPPDVRELAIEVLGSPKEALTWLLQPARSLGGERPIWVAQREEGAQRVKTLLSQIEHGVFI